MANPANPNNNPICNKQISIFNPAAGTTTIATVTDSCEGCAFGDLDVPLDLFNTIAPEGDGRVHEIQWTPIGWSIPGGSGSGEAQSSATSPVQPSSSLPAAIDSAVLSANALQDKVAAVVPSAAAAAAPSESPSIPAVAPSATPAATASSAGQQASSAPTGSTTSCTTAGESVCSADGTQIGTCTLELTVQLGPVASGTKCVGGYMVMANSRLRGRRG